LSFLISFVLIGLANSENVPINSKAIVPFVQKSFHTLEYTLMLNTFNNASGYTIVSLGGVDDKLSIVVTTNNI
jgi:hypothetical protein